MPLDYQVIKIYTSEDARHHGKPLYDAVAVFIKNLNLAARCVATRGIAGCYENGVISTPTLLDLAYQAPLIIEIILPAAEVQAILPQIEEMVTDGVVAVTPLEVHSYRSAKRLLPRQLKVKDIMTLDPETVTADTPVHEVIQRMLNNSLKGLPVVDSANRIIGIITQNDLMTRLRMPLRLGLFSQLDPEQIDSFLQQLPQQTAAGIMTQPVISITENQPLPDAVHIMLTHKLKRLPVVSEKGTLRGVLSRFDIFRCLSQQAPQWQRLESSAIHIGNLQYVKDVMQRDLKTVTLETPVSEIIQIIQQNEIQRLAVVNQQGRLMGLIFDYDLLPSILEHRPGLKDFFSQTFSRQSREIAAKTRAQTAGEVMKKDIISIEETKTIDDAIRLMTEQGFKRLPVVNQAGIFQGIISRDAILRTVVAK